MARKFSNALAVILLVVAVLAALPVTGLYEHSECQWTTSVDAVTTSNAPLQKKIALSVKTGDPQLGPALREGLVAALTTAGVEELVDNPLTWPRADVTVFELAGRYTPFWAPLTLKTKVTLDQKKRDPSGHAVDATVEITGRCIGLVDKDVWMASPRKPVVDAVAALLIGSGRTP